MRSPDITRFDGRPDRETRRAGAWADRIATGTMWCVALCVTALFVAIIADFFRHGAAHVTLGFLIDRPRDAGRAGGIGPIIVSTLAILGVCLAASLPLGTATAILLAEFARGAGGLARLVRASLDILAAVPSIVLGLFGNAFFSLYLGLGFSILSGGLTLACMVLPLLIRSSEEALRAVPDDYRTAAAALGLSRGATLRSILLPAAMPGFVVGLVLAIGRALAETAVLLFTSGYVDRMPESLLDSGRAMSVHIYDLAMNVPGGERHAYATALVLAMLLLAINLTTFYLADRWRLRRITVA
jgi:phosphate transport system permease protein